jgi:hypothetical protein
MKSLFQGKEKIMLIKQTQFIYELKNEKDNIENAIFELVEEANNYGWYYDHILKTKDKNYIVNITLMEECKWDRDELFQRVLNRP